MGAFLRGVGISTLKRDLGLRFTLMLSIFLVMLLVAYIFSSMAIAKKEHDSILINIAGRQRMLIHRYTSEINQVLVGLASSDLEMVLSEKKKSDLTATLFEKIHRSFLDGGDINIENNFFTKKDGATTHIGYNDSIVIPPIENEEIRRHLGHVGEGHCHCLCD